MCALLEGRADQPRQKSSAGDCDRGRFSLEALRNRQNCSWQETAAGAFDGARPGQEAGSFTVGIGGVVTVRCVGWLTLIVGFFCLGFFFSRLLLSLFPIGYSLPQNCQQSITAFLPPNARKYARSPDNRTSAFAACGNGRIQECWHSARAALKDEEKDRPPAPTRGAMSAPLRETRFRPGRNC
jgi:hypothetical protein